MTTRPCTYCGATFEDGTAGRFLHSGPRRRHETRCMRATEAERAYFRANLEWPPSAAQLSRLRTQRRRWKQAYRERRRLERGARPGSEARLSGKVEAGQQS